MGERAASGPPSTEAMGGGPTSFIAGPGHFCSHRGRASAPASHAKQFGVEAPSWRPKSRRPVPTTTGTVKMVTSSITSSSSPCRIATPPSTCGRRTLYLLRCFLQGREVRQGRKKSEGFLFAVLCTLTSCCELFWFFHAFCGGGPKDVAGHKAWGDIT